MVPVMDSGRLGPEGSFRSTVGERLPSRCSVSISPLPFTTNGPVADRRTRPSGARMRDAGVSIRPACRGTPSGSPCHGVAPQVVDEWLLADDPGDDRSRVDPNPQLETLPASHRRCRNRSSHVERQERGPSRMIGVRIRHPRGRHVAIADGIDLLEPMSLHERVEVGEEPSRMSTTSAGGRRCESGVKSTTSANGSRSRRSGRRWVGRWPQPGSGEAEQNVEEEGLGLLLLASERREGIVALVGEGGEEHEGDGTRTDDVQRQHRVVNHDGRSASAKSSLPRTP